MNKSSGYSLGFIVFIVFLILKLCHLIDWSWWWVTSPLWIGWGLIGLLTVGIWSFFGLHNLFSTRKQIKRHLSYSEQKLKEPGKYDSL